MRHRKGAVYALLVSAVVAAGACGGGEDTPAAGTPATIDDPLAGPAVPAPVPSQPTVGAPGPAAGQPPVAAPAAPEQQAPPPAAPQGAGAGAQAGTDLGVDLVLEREVFNYSGSGRDPFVSLLKSGEVRPFLSDLRVTAINFNNRYPVNSVAVLRDTTVNQRYAVRVGDQVGRLRVATIRPYEIVLTYQEFGRELQDTLRLQRTQGGNP